MDLDIAISGVSVISPYGEGVSPLVKVQLSGGPCIPKINLDSFISDIPAIKNSSYELHNVQKLLAAVSSKAFEKADIEVCENNAVRISIFLGNTYGVEDFKMNFFKAYKQAEPELTSPSLFPYTTSNSISAWIAIQFGIKGANITFANGCTSASEAILAGSDAIVAGTCDIALVAAVTVLPEYLSDEFHACGFKNEIAGAIVLEKRSNVIKSGRNIYGLLKRISHSFLLDSNKAIQCEQDAYNAVDCIIINNGNSFSDRQYKCDKAIGRNDLGICCLSLGGLAGNTFSAAGILGIALSSEILENHDLAKLFNNQSIVRKIRFLNIDSYGSCVDTIVDGDYEE